MQNHLVTASVYQLNRSTSHPVYVPRFPKLRDNTCLLLLLPYLVHDLLLQLSPETGIALLIVCLNKFRRWPTQLQHRVLHCSGLKNSAQSIVLEHGVYGFLGCIGEQFIKTIPSKTKLLRWKIERIN